MKPFFTRGDVFGGLAASAVILPQATAFGIAIWAPYGISPATAALAGLITTVCLCLFSGLLRGSVGMVSAPTGPAMVLLGGALATLAAQGYGGEQLVLLAALLLLISGAMQVLIGISNGGRLIKFIPYPVVTGFITGSALLMVLSQLRLLDAQHYAAWLQQDLWIPWVTAASSFIATTLGARYCKKIPDPLTGLLVGTLVFHVLVWLVAVEHPASWLVGSLPGISEVRWLNPWQLQQIPWLLLLPISAALAVLSATNNMLTVVVADAATTERHHAKRELAGQGLGQMLAALLGGIAGSGTTGATLVAVQSGGRGGVALMSALLFGLMILLLGSVAAVLPVSVLAGLILQVAVMNMIKWEMLVWLKRRPSRLDGATALLVVAVTVIWNLMLAIAVGLLLAILQFVRAQIKTPVIHRHSNVAQRPSLRQRDALQRQWLDQHADRIWIVELTGNLFFGTVDHLFETLSAELKRPVTLILDLAKVQHVDLTAIHMFKHMADRLHMAGGELVFTNVRKGKGLSHQVEKSLRRISVQQGSDFPVRTFIDADEAIEYAENKLLQQSGVLLADHERVELADSALFFGMPTEFIQALRSYMQTLQVKSGDYVFRHNDPGDELFVVLAGDVDILLPYSTFHYKRLSKCGPGSLIGEIAFLKHGVRSADARASLDTELLKLDQPGFAVLRQQHPEVALALMSRLAQIVSGRLRWADEELRRLAD